MFVFFFLFCFLGPTTAAGAFGGSEIYKNFMKFSNPETLNIFIDSNDSFKFFENPLNAKYHIITGHTGTNVMDIHLLYFKH